MLFLAAAGILVILIVLGALLPRTTLVIMTSVAMYYSRFYAGFTDEGIATFGTALVVLGIVAIIFDFFTFKVMHDHA